MRKKSGLFSPFGNPFFITSHALFQKGAATLYGFVTCEFPSFFFGAFVITLMVPECNVYESYIKGNMCCAIAAMLTDLLKSFKQSVLMQTSGISSDAFAADLRMMPVDIFHNVPSEFDDLVSVKKRVKAACRCPLSVDMCSPVSLGTQHRKKKW
ncbi:hypothetical protein POM88_049440 [Heracleum sosnowskyi]|uniref:Uncharacterized protein n=1 Tax=Heracleum sosnowskyi TaxID=360622 RepID=A0AAD8GWY2_9APIA|nr:hypothetical protein POM88_049440 [Heracleum sosnowskyi]